MYSLRVTLSLQQRSGKSAIHISLSKAVLEATGWTPGIPLELSWGEGRWRLVESSEGNILRAHGTTGAYWERIIFLQERESLFRRYGVKGASWRLVWLQGISFKRYTYQGLCKSFLVVKGKPVVKGKKSRKVSNIGSLEQLKGKLWNA